MTISFLDKLLRRELTVRELLQSVYGRLYEGQDHEELIFSSPIFAEIANDSGWHGTKVDMRYERGKVININGNDWFISCGKHGVSYPGDPFNSDIIALQTNNPEMIERTPIHYFEDSLIIGGSDGRLTVNPEGRFGRVVEILLEDIKPFIARESLSSELKYPNGGHIVISQTAYRPKLIGVLVSRIEALLLSKSS